MITPARSRSDSWHIAAFLISILFVCAFLLPAIGFSQTVAAGAVAATSADITPVAITPTGGITADNIVTWLTPLIVPLLIAGVKKLLPNIPSVALPIIAPVLGVIIGIVEGLMTAHTGNLWLAALLGLAGVGLREVKDQIKPAN